MSWLGEIGPYLAGPIVAAVAVVYTQVRAERREDRRKANERTDALSERWRDERLDAHAALLGVLEDAKGLSSSIHVALITTIADKLSPVTDLHDKGEALSRLNDASSPTLARVQLLAGDAAAERATGAVLALSQLASRVFLLALSTDDTEKLASRIQKVEEGHVDLWRRADQYLTAARKDLGTTA